MILMILMMWSGMVRICLGWLRAEALVRWGRTTVATTTVKVDRRREGLHIGVLDVAAVLENRTATARLVRRPAGRVAMHCIWLLRHSERHVSRTVVWWMILRVAVHKDCIAERITHCLEWYLVAIVIDLLFRQSGLASHTRCASSVRMEAHWLVLEHVV
jgi:hypothetical protein